MDKRKLKEEQCSPSSPSSPLPFPKRSRRSADRRVVSVPVRAKGGNENAPPPDSWAWRKYGQKPIKGSPYPRGYYRCSSSKGCPARKQVERSKVDPTMLMVTYSGEHNHTWPAAKSTTTTSTAAATVAKAADPDPDPIRESPPPGSDISSEDRFSDLIADEPDELMAMPDDFWYSDVGSTSPPLLGPTILGSAELAVDEISGDGEVDDAFEGLGELPEYSLVFRRQLEMPRVG